MSIPEPPLIPFVRITVAVKSLKETPWSTEFSALLILESCLILSAMVIVIILLFLLIRTQFFHTNCHRLIANTAWHYLIFAVVPRYFEIAYTFYYNSKWNKMNILNVNENGMLLVNDLTQPLDKRLQSPVYCPGIIRIYFAFVGAFTLPALAVERCCAAIYVIDYERNKRSLISVLLILIVDCGSVMCTYINAFDIIGALELVGIVAIVNVIALFVFLYCSRRNLTFYKRSISHSPKITRHTKYSLSARYQNIQNIRVGKVVRKVFIAAWLCTILIMCIFVAVLVAGFNALSRFNFELFDLVISMYANIVPFIIVREIKAFRRETYKVLRKLGCNSYSCCLWSRGSTVAAHDISESTKSNNQDRTLPAKLENVMGVRLIHSSPEDETTAYFTQLQNLWDATFVSLERSQSKPTVTPLAGQDNRNDK